MEQCQKRIQHTSRNVPTELTPPDPPAVIAGHETPIDCLLGLVESGSPCAAPEVVRMLEPAVRERPAAFVGRIEAEPLAAIVDDPEHGDLETRRAAYRLAAASATESCLDLLASVEAHEHDQIVEIADRGLTDGSVDATEAGGQQELDRFQGDGQGPEEAPEGPVLIDEREERGSLEAADEEVGPTTEVTCPECGHDRARWEMKQIRSADESETRFFACSECDHKWREDDH